MFLLKIFLIFLIIKNCFSNTTTTQASTTIPIQTTILTTQTTIQSTTTPTTTPKPYLYLNVSYLEVNSSIRLVWLTNLYSGSFQYFCINNVGSNISNSFNLIPQNNLFYVNLTQNVAGTTFTCSIKISQIPSNNASVQIVLDTAKNLSFLSSILYWSKPNGFYDNLKIICNSTDDAFNVNYTATNSSQLIFIKNLSFNDTLNQSYNLPVDDLVAGLYYKCYLITESSDFENKTSLTTTGLLTPNPTQQSATYQTDLNSILINVYLLPNSYYNTISLIINDTIVYTTQNPKQQISYTYKLNTTGTYIYNIISKTIRDSITVNSTQIILITPPNKPDTLKINQINATSLNLTWSFINTQIEPKFTITDQLNNTYCSNTSEFFCILTNLDPNLVYTFQVQVNIYYETTLLTSYNRIDYIIIPIVTILSFQKYQQLSPVLLSYSCALSWNVVILNGQSFNDINSFNYELSNNQNSIYMSDSYTETSANLTCIIINSTILKCQRVFNNLQANKNYTIQLALQKKFITSPFMQISQYCVTDVNAPTLNSQNETSIQISLDTNNNFITFTQPYINNQSGIINSYWLYLFKTQDVYTSDYINNSTFIQNLVDYKQICNTTTTTDNLCPLKKDATLYKPLNLVLIGSGFSQISQQTDYFDYKIESSMDYYLFLLYSVKIKQTNKRATKILNTQLATYNDQNNLYFVGDLSTFRSNTINANIKFESWMIAIICVICMLFLFIILILGIIVYRRWPLNIHSTSISRKKSQSKKHQTRLQDSSHSQLNTIVSDIRCSEMSTIWLYKHANDDLKFEDEYKDLPDYRDIKTSNAGINNESRNRFLDIKPYDDTRVLLENNPNGTDYINANFIQGFSNSQKFIATQGPLKHTTVDFWHMIFQYRVHAIIMLTNIIEKGMERCTIYWPEHLNVTVKYGHLEVKMKECQKYGEYIKRVFDVWLCDDVPQMTTRLFDSKILCVTQYFYPDWPDKDTPTTDPMSVLHLIRDVNKAHGSHQYPIVVHCSAGVGRTGTYITLDAMYEQINKEQKLNVFSFVKKIREQRQYLVQTCKQYVFIHEALYEYCLYGFTDIEASKLVSHYKYMKETPNNGSKSRLLIEFEKLNIAYMHQSQSKEAYSHSNKHRNRNLDVVCYDENRIKLSSLNGSAYINATKIQGYESNMFIITQDPMPNTIFDFWKMISEYNCQIIVCLNKDLLNDEKSIYWPTDDEPTKKFEFEDLKFCVSLVNCEQDDLSESINRNSNYILRREYEVIENKYSSTHKFRVTQFIYNEYWNENMAPKNNSIFLDLIGQVQKLNSKLDKTPIVVHANGGGSNCSVFCALSILIEQVKADQFVDVCRTVKKLKCQRSHMIETFDQYNFLYECLVEFVGMFGILSCQTSFDRFSNSSLSNRESSTQLYQGNS